MYEHIWNECALSCPQNLSPKFLEFLFVEMSLYLIKVTQIRAGVLWDRRRFHATSAIPKLALSCMLRSTKIVCRSSTDNGVCVSVPINMMNIIRFSFAHVVRDRIQ